jgi:arabinan endo-1,5-alpha-L-arabinosidase
MQQQLKTAYYVNPLTADDFPDPCVIAVEGQGYFAYGTHDEFSPTTNNILVRQSWDLVNWTASEGALVALPVWASQTNRFWSPHVVRVADQYRLYYATNPDTSNAMALGFATSVEYTHFVDYGAPLNKQPGSTFEMIDPCLFIDPVSGKQLLYYGSAHQPIRVVEMATDGKTFMSDPMVVLQPGEGTFHKLREGAFVTYNKSWERYFLWVSGDNTWETNSYAVSVFWSENPLSAFVRIPGEYTVLKPNHIWDDPGHNCIIQDAVGNEWIIYHAVDRKNPFITGTTKFLRQMCMDRVFYTDEGWPYILTGSPSHTEQESPIPMKRPAR